jgi:hypothetical protein
LLFFLHSAQLHRSHVGHAAAAALATPIAVASASAAAAAAAVAVLQMELKICEALEFSLTFPTQLSFLTRLLHVRSPSPSRSYARSLEQAGRSFIG